MGRHSIAGIWDIKRQRWIPELSHLVITGYDWNAYPPIRHAIRSEIVYMAKGTNGRSCETSDQIVARHMATMTRRAHCVRCSIRIRYV